MNQGIFALVTLLIPFLTLVICNPEEERTLTM